MTHEESERERFRKKLDDLWLCVLGNGHPEQGLKWKVEQQAIQVSDIQEFMRTVKGVFWKFVWVASIGALSALTLLIWKVIVYMVGNNVL